MTPTEPDPLNAEGLACRERGDEAAARRCFRQALALAPAMVAAAGNLANGDADAGEVEAAARRYHRALAVAPTLAALHLMLGTALLRLGDERGGRQAMERALRFNPGYPKAYGNLGAFALSRHRPDEAEGHYRQALRGDPAYAPALAGLARALAEQGRLDGMRASARKSVALVPAGRENLGAIAQAAFSAGRHDEARPWYGRLAASADARKEAMLFAHYDPKATSEEIGRLHMRWGDAQPRRDADFGSRDPDPGRRLRVGFLSGDLYEHPVGRNMVGLIEALDADAIETFAYAEKWEDDTVGRRLKKAFGHWTPVSGKDDRAVADLVRADAIDVLVVLAGHTYANRIAVAALRAAPVQVSMHDLTTSGLDTVDWFLGDETLAPSGGSERFSERVMRLPCFYLHMPIEEASPPPRTGRALVLGSCSNPTKLNDRVIATWARILARLPEARLHLKYRGIYGERELAADLGRRFAVHGIDVSRLLLDGRRTSRKNHLDYVGGFDIALDPFPFNGSTTTFEALWMGVPVVTLTGERFVGRVGMAMLERVGLADLAAADEDAYVEATIGLAADVERRRLLRADLRDRLKASSLLDAPTYARSMEKAYRAMWRDWTERQKSTSAAS